MQNPTSLDEKIAHEDLRETLEAVIERTYDVEREYKILQKSVQGLQTLIHQIVESQPNPIWILEKEEKSQLFYQNSASKRLGSVFEAIDLSKAKQEIEIDGEIYLVNVNTLPSEETKTIISATDITEQKRSERLASMGQIAAHLAHEIRNPIGSIALVASALIKRVDAREKPLVEEIKSAINRVERIIKSTLLFTRGVAITPKPFPLHALAREIDAAFEVYPSTYEIDLTIDFPEISLLGDRELLAIVMQNFLYNAVDAIEEADEESGKITFSYAAEGEWDTITITDNGVAISDPNILYEPFKTTKTKGHGLGLALSLEIIKGHRGKIELLEETKGFKIYLPRA